ncbi:Chitosanase/endoglucanase [Chitinispirillum alkaliphilum]|nr:Chitosanase/endoglucanase [Chitinispirillum alkaliphilum]
MKKGNRLQFIGVVVFIALFYTHSSGQYRAFPQAVDFPNTIKPSHVTQQQMNNSITSFYESWKTDLLRDAESTTGGYYIYAPGTNTTQDALTVSEAHGYAMIIAVLMAGYDPEAQDIFDGLFKMKRVHHSTRTPYLMSWQITGRSNSHENIGDRHETATDGDLDMAYALLLAHYQWGSNGSINYLQEAKNSIAAIRDFDMSHSTNRLKLGSWARYTDEHETNTRSSDWMPAFFRNFKEHDNHRIWDDGISTIYSIFNAVRHSTTGLVPDFVVGHNPVPASAYFLETRYDGDYHNNACRVPWRMAQDYIHFGAQESKNAMTRMMDFFLESTGGDPGNIKNGYLLNGTPTRDDRWGPWRSYLSPIMVGAMIDPKYQSFLNQGWDLMNRWNSQDGYYSSTINLLCMLLISGNWWNPHMPGAPDGYMLSTNSRGGTVSVSPERSIYEPGTQVQLTAAPNSGNTFTGWTGDISSSENPVTITINSNMSVIANFSREDGGDIEPDNLVMLADWGADSDNLGSAIDTGSSIVSGGVAEMSYSIVPRPDSSSWPWAEMTASFDNDFTGLSKVTLVYRSTNSFDVALGMPGFLDDGTAHRKTLNASSSWSTVEIPISEFEQPSWVANKTTLSTNNIEVLTILPIRNDTRQTNGTIEIQSIVFDGVSWATSITAKKSKNLDRMFSGASVNIRNNMLELQVNEPGRYSLTLNQLNGRRAANYANEYFSAGSHFIPFNSNSLTPGVYLLNLRKEGNVSLGKVKRVLIR